MMVARGRTQFDLVSFLLPAFVALAAVAVFPSVYLIWMSLREWMAFRSEATFTGLANFQRLLASEDLRSAAGFTALYLVASTALTLVIGLALALVLSEEFRGRGMLRSLLALPLVIPPVVAGFAWKFMLNREVGVVGGYLLPMLGFERSLLADPVLARLSVIVADVWSKTPFMLLILLAGLQELPAEVREAARIDGASGWQELRHVVLPLLAPVIGTAVLFRLLDGINTFDLIYVLTQGGPGISTQTLSILGWKIGFQYYNLGEAAALGLLMIVAVSLLAGPMVRRLIR